MALHFNGTSNFISLADCVALTLTPPWTLSTWLRVGATSTIMQLFSWYDEIANDKLDLYLRGNLTPTNDLSMNVVDANGDSKLFYTYATPRIGSITTWQHYILRCESNGGLQSYVNGQSCTSVSAPNVGGIKPAADFLIGKRYNNDWYWDGDIAEVAKWDVALTESQAASLASGVRPLEIGSRPAWYLPLYSTLQEQVEGITVTNNGATFTDHPTGVDFSIGNRGPWNATAISSQLVAENRNRGQVIIQTNGEAPVSIGIGETAVSGKGMSLNSAGDSIVLTGYQATQAIYGICDAGNTASGGYQAE